MDLSNLAIAIAGAIGLFLLGMSLMSEGLKTLAGPSVRRALIHFTRSPVSGVFTGVAATILTQSSSATMIITVGFVGAGVLAYSQALGVVLGASVGTTFTGWLVALVGFKLQLSAIASILILVGALLRLFGGLRRSGLAYSLAGFGLMFVGIAGLQSGMAGLQEQINLDFMPADRLSGRLVLMLVGIGFTLITQSSTTGVISALAAMHSGLINFEQAASLVVGMNVGTTFTSAVATIGGNVHVRRTGFSHVIFNTIVSGCAIFLVPLYMWLWRTALPAVPFGEFALMGFYTLFNLVGVMLILPFIGAYSRFIERLIPEPEDEQGVLLDTGLLKYPELALSEVRKLLGIQIQRLAEQLTHILGESPRPVSLVETARALNESRAYLDRLHLAGGEGRAWQDLLACIHLLDHLQRLYERCQDEQVSIKLRDEQELRVAKLILMQLVSSVLDKEPLDQQQSGLLVEQLASQEQQLRERMMERIATGQIELDKGVSLMEVSRWIHRVSVHLVRIDHNWEQLNYRVASKQEVAA
ncbi:Na/Pi symporter [Cellvibrio sp. UBA7661]|uniref:Na/Pi cotransporter family protein n=1 Tax=Cellvibrio sp. UBA7661 TaxID=1946311 RepID=UPI002F35F19C